MVAALVVGISPALARAALGVTVCAARHQLDDRAGGQGGDGAADVVGGGDQVGEVASRVGGAEGVVVAAAVTFPWGRVSHLDAMI